MKDRIYVCHTFYHVYVALLKEFRYRSEERATAETTILLSTMSNDFGNLNERLERSGLFTQVLFFEEKGEKFFPELEKYHTNKGNILRNLLQRMIFCRKYAKCEKPYIPVNFREYRDIFVFCDSDPIGYYLNHEHIYYHAVEDGLDCIRYYDTARYDNRGHFGIKAWMAARNLIFIQNGWSKYCIDMEVNDISVLDHPCPKYKEEPRETLVERLTPEEKGLLTDIFIEKMDVLRAQLRKLPEDTPKVLLLTEPLCDLETRKKIFQDILQEYCENAYVIMKPHPRDLLDYEKEFADRMVLDAKFPMEVLNFLEGVEFDRVISVFTVPDSIHFAKEKLFLGEDFMDRYEAPEIHRQNEAI